MRPKVSGSTGQSLSSRLTGIMVVCVMGVLISFANLAFGQTTTGTVTGTVTDAQGAAITGATVVVHNDETGLENTIKTNDAGLYNAPLLQPGTYDVTASQMGFATLQHKGVIVQVGQTIRIDMPMTVASQQSLVTVTTEAPLVETEKTEQSQNVSETLVSDLPISSRRWEQFVLLTPGVSPDGASGFLSFHGIAGAYNNNQVDGANNNNEYNTGARGGTNDGYVYSADSIREFQVASNNYNAEMGQAAGGQVNAVTKSGTSQMHGDLFWNLRQPSLNAIDPASRTAEAGAGLTPTQTVHQQNQFGGSIGGPIIKDKLFYFVTADWYRKITPVIFTTTFPSTTASLTAACPAIGASLDAGGTFTPAMCAAAAAYAQSNLGIFPRELSQNVELIKLDYQINQSNHLSGLLNVRDWKEPNGTSFALTSNSGIDSSSTAFTQDRFAIVTLNTVIGSNKVNEARYQWGIDNNFTNLYGGAPQVGISSFITYGQTGPIPGYNAETRNQLTDNFSFTHGTHTFKFGADVNVVYENIRISRGSTGIYSYSSAVASGTWFENVGGVQTAQAGSACPATGTLYCDWVLDTYGVKTQAVLPLNINGTITPTLEDTSGMHYTNFAQILDYRYPAVDPVATRAGIDQFYNEDYAGYFQDTWKLRPNITVNAGIRYDIQTVPPFPNPNTSKPILSYYTSQLHTDTGGIQPRLAVAWNLAKGTVIRAGGGIFYAKTVTSTFSSARRTSGLREQQFNCFPGASAFTTPACEGPGGAGQVLRFPDDLFSQNAVTPASAFSGTGVVPSQVLSPAGGTIGPNLCLTNPTACAVRGIDPTDDRPRAYEAEAGIEHQLPWNIDFTGTYIFTRGQKLPSHFDANVAPPTTKSYDVQTTTGGSFQTVSVPFFDARIDPSVGVILVEASEVHSLYNAAVLTLRKPASHGLEFLANYTYSSSTDDGQQGQNIGGYMFFSSDGVLNPYNFKLEQGPSATDTPNRLVVSAVWAPTYGAKLSSKVARGALDGWNASATVTDESGSRYSAIVQSSAVQCLISGSTNSACLGTPGLDGGFTGTILNSNAAPSGGRAAFQGRDSQVLPSIQNVDFRLTKQFNIRERFRLEFRGEAFNLFNKTLITAVNTTGFTFANPGSAACPAGHTNQCVVPVAGYQTPTQTSANLLGARQLQFGFRFTF
jgi:hypothetical protein